MLCALQTQSVSRRAPSQSHRARERHGLRCWQEQQQLMMSATWRPGSMVSQLFALAGVPWEPDLPDTRGHPLNATRQPGHRDPGRCVCVSGMGKAGRQAGRQAERHADHQHQLDKIDVALGAACARGRLVPLRPCLPKLATLVASNSTHLGSFPLFLCSPGRPLLAFLQVRLWRACVLVPGCGGGGVRAQGPEAVPGQRAAWGYGLDAQVLGIA